MPRYRTAYPPEFRRQMVDLVRSGRTPEESARAFEPTAQTGLAFCRDPYDRERYEAIRQLAARMFAARTDAPVELIEALFAGETGYATPKVDVRAAVFDDDDRILMVRETSDGGRAGPCPATRPT